MRLNVYAIISHVWGGWVRGGAPPQKKKQYEKKYGEKRKKNNKIKKIDNNYHNAIYKWVKNDEVLRE